MLTYFAQVDVPTDPPVSVAAALMLILILLLTGWLYTRGSYNDQKERADKQESRADRLEEALDEERKAVLVALDVIQELKQLGTLMRRVLEAWPDPDGPPPTPPRRR